MSNLILDGIQDTQDESWAESEANIIAMYKDDLKSVESSEIERAHRLGSFRPQTTRSIIVKFTTFKVTQHVLPLGLKLRDTVYFVRGFLAKD